MCHISQKVCHLPHILCLGTESPSGGHQGTEGYAKVAKGTLWRGYLRFIASFYFELLIMSDLSGREIQRRVV